MQETRSPFPPADHVTLDRQTPRLDPEALQYHLEKAVWARSLGSDGEVEHLVHAAQQFERRGADRAAACARTVYQYR